jgi:hypothetical protein
MMEHTQITETTPRDRFMRAAKKEMAQFEHREIEFRKKDRQERADELNIAAMSSQLGTGDVW